jgi:predicted ester cyclase
MTPDENKALIRRCFDELVNEKKLDALDRYCSEDFFDHNPPAGAREGGIGAAREGFERLHRGLPDVRGKIEEIYAEQDRVFVRSTLTGTHEGDLMGLRPTGQRLKLEVWHLFRLVDGRITEHRAQTDPLMLLRQLGASPQQMADVILIPPRDPLPTTRA